MIKIAIAGIGGVGGYFGGLLAKQFQDSRDVEIYFIARGENQKAIEEKGLKLETKKCDFVVMPKVITSDPREIGVVDFLVCCTKSYDLEESIRQLAPCINKDTIILPLLNGVDNRARIETILPGNEIWDGCVYIVSQLTEPGVIKETGNEPLLFFGLKNGTPQKLKMAEKFFKEAEIKTTLSDNIEQTIWEKFLFLSPVATLSSYSDKCFGAILESSEYKVLLQQLLDELKSVAQKTGVVVPGNLVQNTINTMAKLPYEATTSMHRDFRKGKLTELESLTGYVIKLAKKYAIELPTYKMMYDALSARSKK